MLETILLTFCFFAAVFVLMAVGYIFKGKCLAGTCGGLNMLFGKTACQACEEKSKCLEKLQ